MEAGVSCETNLATGPVTRALLAVTYFVANICKVPEGWFKKTCTKSLGLFVYSLQQNLCD
jgi:hypothetical protein